MKEKFLFETPEYVKQRQNSEKQFQKRLKDITLPFINYEAWDNFDQDGRMDDMATKRLANELAKTLQYYIENGHKKLASNDPETVIFRLGSSIINRLRQRHVQANEPAAIQLISSSITWGHILKPWYDGQCNPDPFAQPA